MEEIECNEVIENSISSLANIITKKIDAGNKKFFNEGFIQYKLIEALTSIGINKNLIITGYPFKDKTSIKPYKIDVAINKSILIEIKYLKRAENEESPAKNQSWGELWRDILKLSYTEIRFRYVLLICDLEFFEDLLKKFECLCYEENYILTNKDLEICKNVIFHNSMFKSLGNLEFDKLKTLKISAKLDLGNELKLLLYKIN